MKKIILFYALFLSILTISAKSVDVTKAQQVAFNFLSHYHQISSVNECKLVYTESSKSYNSTSQEIAVNYFYIFNFQNKGFVIVSADDVLTPIFGYSDQNNFTSNDMPAQVVKWLEGYKEQVRYSITNNLAANSTITEQWNDLLSGTLPVSTGTDIPNSPSKRASVSPLLSTKWNQSPYYNALCPLDNASGQRTVSGCVATAMTQVMKFWNYPTQGTGNHTYSHSKYGNLSANFGATTYNWSSMPNTVTSTNNAVATLTYQVGVSVDMNYGIGSTGGSGAYVISSRSPVTHCTEYALKTYFGYKNTLQGIERVNYSQTNWINLLKAELNASRPIIYAGFGSGGGHCFVADGYDNNDYFHFNWGWGGNADGYFNINALNPGSLGTGGGSGGFNSGHQAVIGIEPPSGGGGSADLDMRLYSTLNFSSSPITYSSNFSLSVDLANFGTGSTQNFNGELAAAVFNSSNQFVAFIETKTGVNIDFLKYLPTTFTSSGIGAMTPGTYTVGVYYKKTGTTDWKAFTNGNYQNFTTITVVGDDQNPLKLYAAITTDPSILIQNQTFDIKFDIANFDANDFSGIVSVDLHKSDGTWIKELKKVENLSLQSGYHFTNGLTFTIDGGLSEEPGTYQLFVWSKKTNGQWEYVGSGNYSNPVNIQLTAPGILADKYENNNTSNIAYEMPLSFNGNIAKTSTIGSNCHNGTDYDYYKFTLPEGYQYTLSPRINDAYKSNDGKTYTLDAVFSYSTNGTTWSDAFDSDLPNSLIVNGNSTFYILVSPYFTGDVGTYLLDISINRTQTSTIVDEKILESVKLYPVPASNQFSITWSDIKIQAQTIDIFDVLGNKVETFNVENQLYLNVNSKNYTTGLYTIVINSNEGKLIKKISIAQ